VDLSLQFSAIVARNKGFPDNDDAVRERNFSDNFGQTNCVEDDRQPRNSSGGLRS